MTPVPPVGKVVGMEHDDLSQLAHAVYAAVHAFPVDPDPDLDVDECIGIWNALDEAMGALRTRVNRWALETGAALADIEYDAKQGYTAYDVTVHHYQPTRHRWNGAKVLDNLECKYVDPETGETVYAVRRDVLDDVLPAVTGGATSSNWRAPKLAEHGVNVAAVRETEWLDPIVKLGPKR